VSALKRSVARRVAGSQVISKLGPVTFSIPRLLEAA